MGEILGDVMYTQFGGKFLAVKPGMRKKWIKCKHGSDIAGGGSFLCFRVVIEPHKGHLK